jgi:hypothetical protein
MLTTPVVPPSGTPELPVTEPAGQPRPTLPEPLTDGGGDRLVVVTPPAPNARPSATLLAAQQLSDEADRYPHRSGGPRTAATDRRRRRQRALVAQRRIDRSGPTGS